MKNHAVAASTSIAISATNSTTALHHYRGLNLRLKSRVVEPTFIHAGLFAMHDVSQRRRFFDLDEIGGLVDETHLKRGPAKDISN